MVCKACKERGKDWDGQDTKCAFESGKFSPDNWNCATMNQLRDMSGSNQQYRDDSYCGSMGIVGLYDMDESQGYLVMTWYKNRGTTGRAYILHDGEEVEALTLEQAEEILCQ